MWSEKAREAIKDHDKSCLGKVGKVGGKPKKYKKKKKTKQYRDKRV